MKKKFHMVYCEKIMLILDGVKKKRLKNSEKTIRYFYVDSTVCPPQCVADGEVNRLLQQTSKQDQNSRIDLLRSTVTG